MPIFISEQEFERCSNDASLVAEKADAYIRNLQLQIENLTGQADAAAITSEQTCALFEQKFISLSSAYSNLENQNDQLSSSIEQKISELAQAQSEKHRLHLKTIEKDGEIERLSVEAVELHKSKRQLLELLEQKQLEIDEKNATIKSYVDKIIILTENATLREAKMHDFEAEIARCHAGCARLTQEKELIEGHNVWLNDELTAKVNCLLELRRQFTESEAEMSSKLADIERQFNDCSSSLKWNKDKVKELEIKLKSTQEELYSTKDAAAINEERFSSELSTVAKLVDLYKESAEEWSRKARDLEGVIKALEEHLGQIERDYNEKIEKEQSERMGLEKETAELKEKLSKCEVEVEKSRKNNELGLVPLLSLECDATRDRWHEKINDEQNADGRVLVPKVPIGVSGTALAASLLRDGWSLTKMYEKYQEAVDALRHEQLGRKHSEAILQRVLYEIEEKAEIILDERVEHERMVEAYALMNEKMQQSLSQHADLENTNRELKAALRRQERENSFAQKEILDLQSQVTLLLKECQDVQVRYGAISSVDADLAGDLPPNFHGESDLEKVIDERLLTFKDINGLVEQNVQLRSLVRKLSDENEQRDIELKEKFELDLKKHMDEAAVKVEAVLQRCEEQGRMIESLHSSVAMYKRLYEEESKLRGSKPTVNKDISVSEKKLAGNGNKDLILLFEGSQEASKQVHAQALERIKFLEEELSTFRSEITSVRIERDKLAMEANFAQERLDSFMKEFEHQRDEANNILARNVEFSQLIVDYQRRIRESSDQQNASGEMQRKLSMEVSILKHEKELLSMSEKKASDEVRSLLERVHRLQASLETIESAEVIREEARALERKRQDEYLKRIEREWTEVKKELQEERDHVRSLTLDRDQTVKNAMRQVEEIGKELADALRTVATAEAKAAVAESRYSELEASVKGSEKTDVIAGGDVSLFSTDKKSKEEIEKLIKEAQANKEHMLQYKEIAQVNEDALKQIESAHERFKLEAYNLRASLETEVNSLRERISELESNFVLKSIEVTSTIAEKEEALSSSLSDLVKLRDENSEKRCEIERMKIQISSLKEDLEKEHQRWRTAQNNYERQVILQSETIQELTKNSEMLAILQAETTKLHKLTDEQKNENDILKATWKSEKSMLEDLKNEAEIRYNEINEQNKILHNRLEALHIKLAEKERIGAGLTLPEVDTQADGDLQNVINYLRRSKEISETEISLLKQEKLRLQSQLESALKASETAQQLLHAKCENSRSTLFSDEEFKNLQIQVREMNLLRESNLQLREENKHNFEECQKFREIAQKAKAEADHMAICLKERDDKIDAHLKQIEIDEIERGRLESRISELLERFKSINVEDYIRMKDDFQQFQAKLNEKDAEIEECKRLISEKVENISSLVQDISKRELQIEDMEKRINELLVANSALKSDFEKQKKFAFTLKKKIEILTKEKEEWIKEKQVLLKQIEDSKSGKRTLSDLASEQAIKEKEKEKDTRIQILEKLLERERENLTKEKAKRQKTELTILEYMKTVQEEKRKLQEELQKDKRERFGSSESVVQPPEGRLSEQTSMYFTSVDTFEEAANSSLIGLGGQPLSTESTVAGEITVPISEPTQPSTTQIGVSSSPYVQGKLVEEKEKASYPPKPVTETRKFGRKLVRPRLEKSQEPVSDLENPEMEGSSSLEGRHGLPHDTDPLSNLSLPIARKRLAQVSSSDLREEALVQPDTSSDGVPIAKRSKGSELARVGVEGQVQVSPEIMEKPVDEISDSGGDIETLNEEINDITKEEYLNSVEVTDELKETSDITNVETQDKSMVISEEPKETESDDWTKSDQMQDFNQEATEVDTQMEEGELMPDVPLKTEGDISNLILSPESGMDIQAESHADPADDLDDASIEVTEPVESVTPGIPNEEKNDTVETIEENTTGLSSDKSAANTNEQISSENELKTLNKNGSQNISTDNTSVKQKSVNTGTETEGKELSAERSTTTINLMERARQRAMLRQAGVASPPLTRGRGRGGNVYKKESGRGRGGRGGRGQTSGDKDQN